VGERSIADYPVDGKRVLVRADFNVPLEGGQVADDTRIRKTLPTIRLLLDRGCAVVLVSHLGRPKGQAVPGLTLDPVATRLAELLERPVAKLDDCVGPAVLAAVQAMQPGDVTLLENLRFRPEETANDPAFAAQLAQLAEVYVDDAFGAAHRAHASTEGVAHLLPAVAGLLMDAELRALGGLLTKPARPFVVLLGGAKVADKVGVVTKMLELADQVLIGGAMCFTFLRAQGLATGTSRVEDESLDIARQALAAGQASGHPIVLPADFLVAGSPEAGDETRLAPADDMPEGLMGLDIGPAAIGDFSERVAPAGTVFWNGPMGLFEVEPFSMGTRALAQAVAGCAGATVVGGGDTVSAVRRFSDESRFTHVSTGGGASMEFLEGRTLPGVAALLDA
jgi:phosphoglycerate kinase